MKEGEEYHGEGAGVDAVDFSGRREGGLLSGEG